MISQTEAIINILSLVLVTLPTNEKFCNKSANMNLWELSKSLALCHWHRIPAPRSEASVWYLPTLLAYSSWVSVFVWCELSQSHLEVKRLFFLKTKNFDLIITNQCLEVPLWAAPLSRLDRIHHLVQSTPTPSRRGRRRGRGGATVPH